MMRKSNLFIAVIVVLQFGIGRLVAEVRTWTDSTGKFSTEAEFVSYDDGIVTLKKPGTDMTVKLPLERLSDPDQEYVDDLLRELENEQESRDKTRPADVDPADPPSSAPANSPRRTPNNVINSVRGAVYRTQTINNLKQIATAILMYESSRGSYPPAAIMTRDRQPALSWRVAILPMIEENALYRQFKLDEPWDSQHNKALIERMPAVFQSPGSDLDQGYTNYLAVTAPETVLSTAPRSTRMRDVRGGTSQTVMLVEADDTYASIWTKPNDYDWDPTNPAYGLGGIWNGIFFAAFADGQVKSLNLSIGTDQLNALFTRSGD